MTHLDELSNKGGIQAEYFDIRHKAREFESKEGRKKKQVVLNRWIEGSLVWHLQEHMSWQVT